MNSEQRRRRGQGARRAGLRGGGGRQASRESLAGGGGRGRRGQGREREDGPKARRKTSNSARKGPKEKEGESVCFTC